MSAPPPTASWTTLLAAAVAHDINNLVHGLASGAATLDEGDLELLRKLAVRLGVLASAGGADASARLDDACADALADVDPAGRRVRAEPIPAGLRVAGTAAALTTALTCLLEHVLAATPSTAEIRLAVRSSPGGGPVIAEIAAPEAPWLGSFAEARLDALLATTMRDQRGDFFLVLAGAIADAVGGAVHVASDAQRGLVFALHLVPTGARPGP
jgi:hypothetical protein